MKVETRKENKLLTNILTGNNTEPNELIYAEAKLICGNIGVPLGNPNRHTKPGCKFRLEDTGKETATISKSVKTSRQV